MAIILNFVVYADINRYILTKDKPDTTILTEG